MVLLTDVLNLFKESQGNLLPLRRICELWQDYDYTKAQQCARVAIHKLRKKGYKITMNYRAGYVLEA